MAKVFLFVVFAAATSARHLTEVNRHLFQPLDPEYDASTHNDQIVQRRNIDYNSRTSTNAHHRRDKHSSYIDQASQHEYAPDYQSSIKIDSDSVRDQEDTYDNIYNESEYGVRRSAIPKPVVDLNHNIAYTNLRTKRHHSPHNTRSNMRNNQYHSVAVRQKTNNLLPDYEKSLETIINPASQNTHRRTQSYNNGNHVKTPIMPRRKEPSDNKEEENKWIWDSDPPPTTKQPNLTKSRRNFSISDRAIFSGDKCATNYVKIKGKCVEDYSAVILWPYY